MALFPLSSNETGYVLVTVILKYYFDNLDMAVLDYINTANNSYHLIHG